MTREENKLHHEYAELLRFEYMLERPFRFSLPDGFMTLEQIHNRMAEIEQFFQESR